MKNISEQGIKQEKNKHPSEMLKGVLFNQAKNINNKVKEKYNLNKLLKNDLSLNPEEYTDKYTKEELEIDKSAVRKCEIEFTGADDENVKKYYADQHKAFNEDEIITTWHKNISREKSGQTEMAIVALLSEKLGDDFLIVRTAAYDDYKNGVDNLIIDLKTGKVVGAFDEVHGSIAGGNIEEKREKVKKIAKRGGAEIKYGLSVVDGKIKREGLNGVPVFYLSLMDDELKELLEGLSENDATKKDKIFKRLIDLLSSQKNDIKQSTTSTELRERIDSFGQTLLELQKSI